MLNSEMLQLLPEALLTVGLLVLAAVFFIRRPFVRSLKDQNTFLQTLIESIPSPVFYKNGNGLYLGCNEAFLTMLGRTKEEVVGKSVYDLSPKHLAEIYERADKDLFEKQGVQRYETQVEFADGTLHDMYFTKSVFHDARGEVAGLLGVMLDISARKQAENELKEAHEHLERKVAERTLELQAANRRLEDEIVEKVRAERESREKSEFLDTVINSIEHGLVVVDAADYTVKLANSAIAKGRNLDGMRCHQLLHGSNLPCIGKVTACPLHKVKETKRPIVTQHNHVGPDGSPRYVEIHSYPVFNDKGDVVQIIDNIMDVTKRKEAEKAIVDAKDMAEATNRLMSEFLDTVSHELRTPMTSVHGFAKLIQKTFKTKLKERLEDDPSLLKPAERIEENIAIILTESERLSNLINDHLDLSKLQSGRMDWRQEKINPADLVARVGVATASLFEDKPIKFEAEVEEELPSLQGDPDRLLQVLINLVSNAEKFTKEGKITCRALRTGDDVVFSVSDTGIGIPKDQQELIFSKFRQVQNKIGGKPSGTGLGLAISKEIVTHHGGRIWVESTPGEGSTFFFSVPA
ncbi:PAS domain S-box protein [Pseudodesulfovibrio cashew]|uniref:histidine kinase n=1 Tax=Pseudodesulfovibrio cashew TaxID=2678688 RepID=A0A6I6JU30_9BACT|nr:PAS domain-containing sensor histidine kinase [Pseudodesulfovibrio cashew]QGY41204.1 PAS domain S-box protein [Pseudodesulfovibrio cashew]